ncbi:hypothetical protein [Bradyrhizobium sp. CCBAU 53421]|uniref:hypothetical protein n=1 Tax=Bradyrhizobium sp. CCBAU 53421 TaxID=1325120 RepID=UPI00188AF1A4|nr:hypothetical protein [Bradyrhizobium sp. CCBAU 53421]QOZ33267.1 hypothetical protein XH92_17640 [Bradyrhizobium sp. CCBAU 53421]
MRLVFVHGMRQEGRPAAALLRAWRDSLYGAWDRLGLARPAIEPEMPYYGDTLDQLTRELHGGSNVIGRGGAGGDVSPVEEAMIREFATVYGVEDAEVRAELGSEVIAKGPANWEWVQAIGRVLERRVPLFRTIGISLVVQVDAYLNRPHVTQAVDEIVAPQFKSGPVVIVSHSLGTIVSYRLLRQTKFADVPLLVTLGSPLGINAVKDRIAPPKLARPVQVGHWLNGSDERDFVALYASLDAKTFCDGIENVIDIHNSQDDAHSILDYLKDERIARSIHVVLSSEE